MRKISIIFVTTLILLLTLTVDPAAASSRPLAINFESTMVLPGEGLSYGTFTASGPAVDAGIVCPSGDVIDESLKVSGFQSQTGMNFQVAKRFTCADGSGEFFMKLQVRIDRKGNNFHWVVTGGTGPYERLHGTGSGYGTSSPDLPGIVFDHYKGKVHID